MRKFYSFVLMATMLFIGTNVWAATLTVGIPALNPNYTDLGSAINAANDGDVIQLLSNVTSNSDPIAWIGTTSAIGAGAKHLTLDLGGFTYTYSGNKKDLIALSRGSLTIKNGKLEGTAIGDDLIRIWGTYEKIDAKTSTPFAELIVEADATIASSKNVISVDVMRAGQKAQLGKSTYDLDYSCQFFNHTNAAGYGVANGVKVEIAGKLDGKKYGIKVNGTIRLGNEYINVAGYPKYEKKSDTENYLPASYAITANDSAYSPYVHIAPTAEVKTSNPNSAAAVAVYASGYARWLVEGTVEGSSGVYVKSGEVDIHDANVSSNFAGTYDPISGSSSSGVTGAGSAVAIESNEHYTGNIDVEISGDSKLHADNGYALEEKVTNPNGTDVNYLTISGGTFEGGNVSTTGGQQNGTISISQTTIDAHNNQEEVTTITVLGGTVDKKEDATFGNQDLNAFLNSQQSTNPTHLTTISDENGNSVVVISKGSGPVANNTIKGHNSEYNIKWNGTSETIGEAGDPLVVEIGELEINEMEDTDFDEKDDTPVEQVVYIKDGYTLKAKRVIMGHGARIIVEAGGKFIVTGTQGIVAPNKENIVLQHNSNNGKYATFLFNDAVTSNRHPKAKVQFTTNSWRESADAQQWEWFGIPTYNKAEAISSTGYAYVAVYENADWTNLGYIGGQYDNNPAVLAKLDKPFTAYDMLAFRAHDAVEDAPTVTIAGELVGNIDGVLRADKKWNPFANSYTAEIDALEFVNALKSSSNIDDALYLATQNTNGTITWNAKPDYKLEGVKLQPMQAFMLLNNRNIEETAINYVSMVYNPATIPANSGAPRRSVAGNTMVTINVANENGTWDDVDLIENSDAKSYEKYLNSDINIYVVDGEKNDIAVVEDMENTYVGFSTIKGGNFTISFAKAEGREFDLIDLETGARVAVSEGETYSFSAAANSANDYRFKLVAPAKMPTAIENTEVKANAKGIFTLTGQFVGEMNVWNSLPAGIYVVNGAKRVK